MKKVLAFDLGASSGRGIIATLDGGKITLKEIHRFANNGVKVRNTFYWDILYLFDQIKQGIVKAKHEGGFDSIGIDTWGVDFGLLDKNGDLIDNPVHYRDDRTQGMQEELFKLVDKKTVYDRTGIQFMNFNTIFQMFYLSNYKQEILERAKDLLFIPDLLNYFLTNVKKSEYTIASTSQMINPYTKDWDRDLLKQAKIDDSILCDIIDSGETVGNVSESICEELGIEPVPVVAVGEHDTASAVVAVPTQDDDFVYISCGTWSLFGTELKEPVISEKTMENSFTNEGACGRKIKFLTNIMGLWLIQESRRQWIKEGMELSFNDMEKAALNSKPFACFIDPDYPEFGKPGNIPQRIKDYCKRTGQYVPQNMGEVVRCIYESLALKYKHSYINLKDITGKDLKGIHIVGGGTKDPLLCRMCASACNTGVSAGPVEATALGNVAMQFIASKEIKDIKEARKIIEDSFDIKKFEPENAQEWDKAYERFTGILGK